MLIHDQVALQDYLAAHIDIFLLGKLSAGQIFCQSPDAHIALSVGIFLDHIVEYAAPDLVRDDGGDV